MVPRPTTDTAITLSTPSAQRYVTTRIAGTTGLMSSSSYFYRYHVDDVLVVEILVAVLFILGATACKSDTFFIPNATSNTNYQYPIQLAGKWFYPDDINSCVNDPTAAGCDIVWDRNIFPFEEIPDIALILMLAFISLTVLLARCSLWVWMLSYSQTTRSLLQEFGFSGVQNGKGFLATMCTENFLCYVVEISLGLVFSVSVTCGLVFLLKYKVAYPRPLYYALTSWASIHPDLRWKQNSQAGLSFPSGHAASSAAVYGYFVILLLCDVKTISHDKHLASFSWVQKYLWLTIWILVTIIFYTAATRVRDYWHFAGDVAGMYF
jgi:membrane-associated phospholipid phosphatase